MLPAETPSSLSPRMPRPHDWPHSPVHHLTHAGTYLVTGGTYQKVQHFYSAERLTFLTDLLFSVARSHNWNLHAWAVFSNHYHFLADSSAPESLRQFIRELHSRSALEVNHAEGVTGRKIWFQFWESQITFHKSFLARLNYVHQNPVRHKLVPCAERYAWCSMGWFRRKAEGSFFRTVTSFPIDALKIPDDF
jgi:putative transposase